MMNKEEFFKNYPIRKKTSNKFDNGHLLIVAGSYGMAGACILNIIGVRSVGASYIEVLLPDNIYEIVASNEITTVYHPDNLMNDNPFVELKSFNKVKAIGYGSGMANHPYKKEYLRNILNNAKCPIVIDAEGLRILSENEDFYSLNNKMILTPHLGEFSLLTKRSIEDIKNNTEEIALNFVKHKNVILVLKGPNTLVISKNELYINDTGNEALARAGSGDVLTGMITGLCALYDDTFKAVKDAVWLHGYLADEAIKTNSKEIFDLTKYPLYANDFFKSR